MGVVRDWNEVNTNTPGQSLATPSILGVTNDGSTATPYVNGTGPRHQERNDAKLYIPSLGCMVHR